MSQQDRPNPHDKRQDDQAPENLHPAGPHAKPELTDNEKTPGTGSLPEAQDGGGDVGPD